MFSPFPMFVVVAVVFFVFVLVSVLSYQEFKFGHNYWTGEVGYQASLDRYYPIFLDVGVFPEKSTCSVLHTWLTSIPAHSVPVSAVLNDSFTAQWNFRCIHLIFLFCFCYLWLFGVAYKKIFLWPLLLQHFPYLPTLGFYNFRICS